MIDVAEDELEETGGAGAALGAALDEVFVTALVEISTRVAPTYMYY